MKDSTRRILAYLFLGNPLQAEAYLHGHREKVKAEKEQQGNALRRMLRRRAHRAIDTYGEGVYIVQLQHAKSSKPRYFKFNDKNVDDVIHDMYDYLIETRTSLSNTEIKTEIRKISL